MKASNSIFSLFIFICCCLLSACFTDKYDFDKEFSLGISTTEDGFYLPKESDIDIPMSQLIELSDSSELTVDAETGNYLFYKKKDSMDTISVSLQRGSLCGGTLDELDFPLHQNSAVVLTPNKRNPEFASLAFETVIMPSFDPDQLKDAIRELFYMHVNLDIDVTMNFNHIEGFSYINELVYEVPFFFVVADESELIEKNVRAEGLHNHKIHIVGVDFSRTSAYEGDKIGINPTSHKLEMRGGVRVKGSVKTVNVASFEAAADAQINYRVMVGTLGTLGVTGRFDQRERVSIDPLEFDDLPDFIKDEEVSLDIENPLIRLSLWNQMPADISLNAVLTGMRDEKAISTLSIGADYGTEDIVFHGPDFGTGEAVQTNIWVSRVPVEQLPDSVDKNVTVPEVMNIVRHMPDAIYIDAYARTDSTKVFTLSLMDEYKAVPRYEMYVPLKMGRDMKIVYNKDFENLNKSLKHIDLNEIVITAQAENHLPLDLSMKMEAYDCDGQEISGLTYDLPDTENPIPGQKRFAMPADAISNITIGIRNAGRENALQQLDHLRLKLYATSSAALEGQYLNRNQNLQLRNIKVMLK